MSDEMIGTGISDRLNRHLRISRRASAALMLGEDEPTLLQAMCGVVTETKAYGAAWIGLCEAGMFQVSRPVAWSENDGQHFQKCEAMRPLTGWGSGLARIQSPIGKPCVMPLGVPDPSLEPWRQEALKRGYHMSASFPLISLGGIIGSLTVVAADPGEFDVIGLDLLGQVAGGLSYGLRALRDRRARAASVVQLAQSIEATVAALATMLDERDPYTADHQRRVADLAVAIARELAMTEADVHGIRLAALIHDVGKIAVPAEILNRPGKLTAAQFEIVKTHVQAGFDIVKGIAFPWPVAQTILQHHERLDGSGYPNGLKRDGILLDARIVAVADVVDAINSFRPYRPSRGAVAAIMEIEGGKGRHFDPDVVDACVRALRNGTFEFEMETN